MSDYKKIMGYKNTKKVKNNNSKINKVLESIKDEFNLSEGPAYEYKKKHKNVEKSLKNLSKDYLDFYDTLRKKGLDDEASDFLDNYKKNIVDFTKNYKKLFSKLL